ncbi:PilN domain-containing protein [Halobacillus salinus]|uniref:PilN domain-containing protein n=1 Tax=Halobacillus salinus TaxID=192814 RepID=UPI0009A7A644|nr:hypothetical protein [Halobacillus salinus]
MVIDINLLEEKEQPNRLPLLIIGAGVFVLCLIIALFFWQHQALEEEQKLLNEEVEALKTEQTAYQTTDQNEEQAQRQQLKEATQQLQATVFPTVALVENLIALLPERGYFQSYTYDDSGFIDIEVRFDSLQEVAAYTNALSERNYATGVEMGSVLTEQTNESLNQFEYRPRYIANYTVTIDKQLFREGGADGADRMEP